MYFPWDFMDIIYIMVLFVKKESINLKKNNLIELKI